MHASIEIIGFHNSHVIYHNEFMLLRDQIVYKNSYWYIHISYPIEWCPNIMIILADLIKYMGQIFQFSNMVDFKYCALNLSNWIDDVQQNVRRAIIIATTISGTILVLVIAIGSWLLWRNKQKHYVLLHQAQESKW
jgi:hypothetical protein